MPQETPDNRMYILLIILAVVLVIIAAGLYASVAGSRILPEQKTLSVSGTASEFVIPDTASISVGVLTMATTAKEASEKNAATMNAVISSLKSLGLQDKDIQTSYLSIQPVYRDGENPVITNYSASNNVVITTKMLNNLSDIVDKSVASGANQIGGISFTVSEEKQKQIHSELLGKAIDDASTKGKNLADDLKVRIIGVKTSSISEGGFPPLATAIAEKAATPVLPGELQVSLTVQVTYIIE